MLKLTKFGVALALGLVLSLALLTTSSFAQSANPTTIQATQTTAVTAWGGWGHRGWGGRGWGFHRFGGWGGNWGGGWGGGWGGWGGWNNCW
ncbi:MAG: hypothetical protein ABI234_15455 [Ktedonobacteraceae bacterium]